MKILFILLLISNAAYLAWNLQSDDTPVARSEPQIPEGVTKLTLLTESEIVEPQTDIKTMEVETASPAKEEFDQSKSAAITCYSIGPYNSESNADKASDQIQAEGFTVSQRVEIEQKPDTIWVYIPPFESRIATLEVTAQLDAEGVKDYYVIPTPPKRNAISLGVYKRPERAQRRAAEITSLGFSPEQETRYEDISHYWIDYEEEGGKTLAKSIWNERLPEDESVKRIERPCN